MEIGDQSLHFWWPKKIAKGRHLPPARDDLIADRGFLHGSAHIGEIWPPMPARAANRMTMLASGGDE